MRGVSHALSGLVTGAAAGEYVMHLPVPGVVAMAGFTAGMALLPDMDSCGSSQARCLGFLSYAVSRVVRLVSGGHRHASHSLAGVGVFTGLAWLACHFRGDVAGKAGLALLVTLAVSSALEALHLTGSHLSDVIAIGVAAAVVWYGYDLRLIPLAVLAGTATHCLGDSLTDSGVMWLYPFSQYRFRLPEPVAFTTGSRPERWIVVPVLLAALGFLAYYEVTLSLPLHHLVAGG